ncbi:hypothetical protein PHIM7_343 [Sinorhizobium phage phiM7]|uniref:Uncharacterized protein n=2 Tax=Emdodecavirus TaxID=1980937 RepID=S5MBS8_9CAUD|nr:hypothetical protein AB690_gp172 [Sinorhizobium phage phiM12]YP_009601468.1 hypothetical protein FDH46_gp135 [Sinorhizobium phage phiM7]AGR48073.1 hypothetical protein SmphiM12_441 [Sinorhizobium phage phiM12]AKF12888.1 hypothetical protein PHIM7_343 [Sinorhizobium phage phiM7]AKF13248.1 hypothetical protein PHIM19_343 [Sinorhizobium phage phiM19]
MVTEERFERFLNSRFTRRVKIDEKLEARAEQMIGELCRDGCPVYYVMHAGGRYREGARVELVDFLIRNNYV